MNKTIRTVAMFTCLTTAALAGGQAAFAELDRDTQPGAGRGEMHKFKGERKGHFLAKIAVELQLNERQKAQTKELFEKGQAEHRPLMEALRVEKRELQTLIHSGKADEATIRAQAAEVAAIQSDLAVRRGEQAKKFHAMLTPEQASKLKELQQKRKGHLFGDHRCDDSPQ